MFDVLRVPCLLQQFLTRALMPLHKPKCVAMYHQQLAYCVTQVGCAALNIRFHSTTVVLQQLWWQWEQC
jgi:hypothetical protein